MKMILLGFCVFTLLAAAGPRASAQESATQQEIDQVNATLQDVQSQLDQQDKRITALEQKMADLADKVNTPGGSDYASADDLKKLAEQVQEIDKKRQEDNQKILDAIAKLGRGGSAAELSRHAPDVSTTPDNPTPPANGQAQNGFYYKVAPGNTLSAIAKAYQAKGYKVTVKQIEDANPGLNPASLKVGQQIFIPQP
jgi:LysM repeat protein